jgi:hypothetical protein
MSEELQLEFYDACKMALLWASTPGNHGGNPYTKTFVKCAELAVAKYEGREPEEWAKTSC